MNFVLDKLELLERKAWEPEPGENAGRNGCESSASRPAQMTSPDIITSEPSDDALMALAAAGDQEAFRSLMARHFRKVYSLVYRMIPNAPDAEDLAQDVFFTVWVKRAEWRPGVAAFSTWLYRVTVNRCIDFKRKSKPADPDAVADLVDDRPDAAAILQQNQASQILRTAILKLSDEQQAALALFYQQGLSNLETAEVLGTTVSAVESLLKRARKRLREILRNRSKDLIGDSV